MSLAAWIPVEWLDKRPAIPCFTQPSVSHRRRALPVASRSPAIAPVLLPCSVAFMPRLSRLSLLLWVLLPLGVLGWTACTPTPPDPSSTEYTDAVSAFYTGVAAIQVGELQRAEQQLGEAAKLVSNEPAIPANQGVLALRQRSVEAAAEHLADARDLAPDDAQILFLSAEVAREQGELEPATSFLQRALDADSSLVPASYALVQIQEQRGNTAAALQATDRLTTRVPENLVGWLTRARLAAKQGDAATVRAALARIDTLVTDAPERARTALSQVQSLVDEGSLQQAATEMAFLDTALKPLPLYQQSQRAVATTPGSGDLLVTRFRWMQNPDPRPAPIDSALAFPADTLDQGGGPWSWTGTLALLGQSPPNVIVANGETVEIGLGFQRTRELSFPGGASAAAPARHGITGLDYDYDYDLDVALAGRGGVRLYRHGRDSQFENVSADALPASVRQTPAVGAWAADLDMEGDVDLVVDPVDGAPIVLRNNGDGTFETQRLFDGIERLRDFDWADLDADGDPDAVLLDADGQLHVHWNHRRAAPRFRPASLPDGLGRVLDTVVFDADQDGHLDLIALQADGSILRLSHTETGWTSASLLSWDAPLADRSVGDARLFTGDVDNNGALDLVASTPDAGQVWLHGASGYYASDADLAAHVFGVADVQDRGRLDLVALTDDGTALRLAGQGTKDYQSVRMQPQAARAQGDRRINSFGIGGEVELRAGLLFQKQVINDPLVHFGLGEQVGANVARILWPNGTVQAEFDLLSTQTVQTRQRLKGSCPWVFTHNGDDVQFVTDFLWRTALGLRINAQGPAQVIHSVDWIKMGPDALAPRDGQYDVRITGELWESHFFDHVSLLTVDRPTDTRVFVNETFQLPAPEQKLYVTGPLQPVQKALDMEGRDVTQTIRERDGQHVDTFELQGYQGLAEEHAVELHLGDDVPADGPLWLVASGWVYPTDSSINLAISQGDHDTPHGVRLEVPDGNGGWRVAKENLGFPAGKNKTMMIDLQDVIGPDGPRRIRLRTNMEIYWDRMAWAEGRPDAPVDTTRINPATAELRYRGFSVTHKPKRSIPETPVYDTLKTTSQIWRDLEGYHTRFGDVRELITAVDDRYVIMNAGDEMALRFDAPAPLAEGHTREFVLIGDGWVKDGDYNTGYSRTVRPLPYHGLDDYTVPPQPLTDDPAYQMHPEDWTEYHTRYVTPRRHQRALAFR